MTPLGVGADTLHDRWAQGDVRDRRRRRRVPTTSTPPSSCRSRRHAGSTASRSSRVAASGEAIARGGLGRRVAVRPAAGRVRDRDRDRRSADGRGTARRDARARTEDGLAARDPAVHAQRGGGGGLDEALAARPELRRRVGLRERRARARLGAAHDPVRGRRRGRLRRRRGDADRRSRSRASTRCRRCRRPASRARSTCAATGS